MKQITENFKIVQLFLEKLELLTEDERRILIKTIDLINHPIFEVSGKPIIISPKD